MSSNRIAAGILSIVLLALLVGTLCFGVANLQVYLMLGLGATIGMIYAILGRLPDWISNGMGGSLTDDDAPENISPGIYLPVIFVAILIAVITWVVVLYLF